MEPEHVPVKTKDGIEVNAIDLQNNIAPTEHDDADANTKTAKPKGKRGPGRPKTRTETPHTPSEGIVTEPTQANHIIEMVYRNPMIFRKIFALLKNFGIGDLQIKFTKTTIEFTGRGHYKTETIQLTIFGEALTRYYARDEIERTVHLMDIEKKTKTVNKGHGTLSLLMRDDDERSTMHMILNVSQYDADLPLPIQFKANTGEKTHDIVSDENYPIKFEIDSAQFKSIITSFDSGLSANILSIKKVGEGPMFVIPQKDDKQLSDGIPFKNPQKIKLQSRVEEDDIFSASVRILHFKPLAAANIGDKIEIAADKQGPMSFTTWIDRTSVTRKVGDEILTDEGFVARLKLFVNTQK